MKILIILAILIGAALAADVPQSERQALAALYRGTNGTGWHEQFGWSTQSNETCEWAGVKCARVDGTKHVPGLELLHNNLAGALGESIGDLQQLQYLDLSGNSLGGELPQSFATLTELRYLDLGNNRLTGAFPSDFGALFGGNLETAVLSLNRFNGSLMVETWIASVRRDQQLDLFGNIFACPVTHYAEPYFHSKPVPCRTLPPNIAVDTTGRGGANPGDLVTIYIKDDQSFPSDESLRCTFGPLLVHAVLISPTKATCVAPEIRGGPPVPFPLKLALINERGFAITQPIKLYLDDKF
jgi:Leucine rich repeat